MTSNQIAAANERETERHNAVVEQETERHNQSTENLTDDANRITESYNTQKLTLEKEYNDKYIEYLNADSERKNAIQQELNAIKAQEVKIDEKYKSDIVAIQGMQAAVDEKYKNALVSESEANVDLAMKRSYYEEQKTEAYITNVQAQIQLEQLRYENEKKSIENQFRLGIINDTTRLKQLELQEKQYQLEKDKLQSQIDLMNAESKSYKAKGIYYITGAINNGLSTVGSAARTITDILGGL